MECDNKGDLHIKECPLRIITNDIWELLDAASLYIEHGLPIVAGGQDDQSVGFIEAVKFIASEKQYWKKKLGIFD